MKSIENIVFILQARLSSERLPKKMLRPFADTNLMQICIDKVKRSNMIPISQFYLAVNEPALIELGQQNDVNVFERTERSMRSEGSPIGELYEWWCRLPFSYAVLISACAPLLKVQTIDRFVTEYLTNESDGLFSVVRRKNYYFSETGEVINGKFVNNSVMNTKNVTPLLEAAHCLYAGRMDRIGEGIWMGTFDRTGDPPLFSIPEEEAYDIDYKSDFLIAEQLYKLYQEKGLMR